MTTLMQIIEDAVLTGHTISFKQDGLQLSIRVSKKIDNSMIKICDQYLPLSDHFTEQKIVPCIYFQMDKLK